MTSNHHSYKPSYFNTIQYTTNSRWAHPTRIYQLPGASAKPNMQYHSFATIISIRHHPQPDSGSPQTEIYHPGQWLPIIIKIDGLITNHIPKPNIIGQTFNQSVNKVKQDQDRFQDSKESINKHHEC